MGKWKTLARVVTYPLIHPGTTARTTLNIGKSTAVMAGAGYVGWEMLTKDKSLVRVVGDTVIGEDNVDAVVEKAKGVSEFTEHAGEKLSEVTDAITHASGAVTQLQTGMNGVSNFFGNILHGNGGTMFGNFFSNLTSGKVGGLGLFGLIAGALLAFGRFGWLGKIAGALMMMFTIGNNAQRQVQQQQPVSQRSAYAQASVYPHTQEAGKLFVKAWDKDGRDYPALEISKHDYYRLKDQGHTPVSVYAMLAGDGTEESESLSQKR